MKPTLTQVAEEIAKLEACKSYAPKKSYFGEDNHYKIDLQLEVLRGEVDVDNIEEWDDYAEDEQSAMLDARDWMNGDNDESPSSGWDGFKPKN